MTFEQADRLMWRILDFLMECGGCYTEDRTAELQETVLIALATRQFVIKISGGRIRYFACWWFVTDEDLDAVLDWEHRCRPADIVNGRNVYVAEVAIAGGDAREMIKRIIKAAKKPDGRAFWHKAHRNGLLLKTVKHAR